MLRRRAPAARHHGRGRADRRAWRCSVEAPRSADIIAQTDVELLVIKNERLDWLIRNRPQLTIEVLRRLSNWVVQTDRERALRQPMTEPLRVPVLRVGRRSAACPPTRVPDDAGLDLHAAEDVTLAPGARALVPTGLALAIPPGYAGFVLPRSGLALRHGVTLLNTPGLIDAGYRGEVQGAARQSRRRRPSRSSRGDRIAQLVVQRVERVTLTPVSELPPSTRGTGGFGSTGT